jgi:general secretion pathway protein D
MRRAIPFWPMFALILLWMAPAPATSADFQRPTTVTESQPNLKRLIDSVARATKKRFLIAGALADISWSGVDDRAISYPMFLSILMDNNLAAVDDDGIVHIVSLADVRQYPTPAITEKDLTTDRIPDNQVVSIVLQPRHVEAVKLVPILRPLMPQWAQLSAATAENAFIMTDRFANVRRMATIIRALDQMSASH